MAFVYWKIYLVRFKR